MVNQSKKDTRPEGERTPATPAPDDEEPESDLPESKEDPDTEPTSSSSDNDDDMPSSPDDDADANGNPQNSPDSEHGHPDENDALNEEDLDDIDDDGFDGEHEDDEWWLDGPPQLGMGMFNNDDEDENPEDLEWWEEEEDVWIGGDEEDEDDEAAFWEDHDDDLDDDDDDISETSTLEPEEEAEACIHAAEVTRDRHLVHPPCGYMLPSSTFHFQSADAVAVSADPFCPGASLIAAMDSDGVLLFRMPATGELTQTGGPPQAMQFLGGFESPSMSAYSMEISPSGRYLLAGGDEGSLEIFAIDSSAPQRPPIPRQVVDGMAEQQPFFYLPIIPPESDWVTGNRPDHVAREVHELLSAPEADEMRHAHGNVYRSYPRTLNDALFLNILGFRDAAFLTSVQAEAVQPVQQPEGAELIKRSPLGWVPKDVFFAAAVDDQYRGLEHQFNNFSSMLGGKDKFDWKMERVPEEPDEQEGTTTAKEEQSVVDAHVDQKGAIALGGVLVLGYHNQQQAEENTMNPDGMVNGIRFGLVGGKERILAADQSGRVYIFEIPPADCAVDDIVGAMMCSELVGEGESPLSDKFKKMPVVVFPAKSTPLGTNIQRRARILNTVALGPFGVPLNLAAASPDGKWIALVGDQQKVILIDQSHGFTSRELSFEPARFDYDFLDPEVDIGSQYCAWNASSSLLAVTSDALHAVFVFAIPSGQLLMRVEGFVRTIMPVVFAPWNDRVVIFAEETKMVHVRVVEPEGGTVNFNAREDLAEPGLSSQLIRIPADPRRPKGGRRRITGMATIAQGDLVVSTKQGIVYRYLPADEWVPRKMNVWPVRFRQTAQTLLKCASRRGGASSSSSGGDDGLTVLPGPVVQHIIKHLAGKKTDWLDVVPDPAVEAQQAEQLVEAQQAQQAAAEAEDH